MLSVGLKLTDGLLAAVARQQLPSGRFLLKAIGRAAGTAGHGDLSELCASVVLNREVCRVHSQQMTISGVSAWWQQRCALNCPLKSVCMPTSLLAFAFESAAGLLGLRLQNTVHLGACW
jgi:hypothetical protein